MYFGGMKRMTKDEIIKATESGEFIVDHNY